MESHKKTPPHTLGSQWQHERLSRRLCMGCHGKGRLAQRHLSGKPAETWRTSIFFWTISPYRSQFLSVLSPLHCIFELAFWNCNSSELVAWKKASISLSLLCLIRKDICMSTKCCLTTRYSEVNENSLKKCIQAIEAWIENEPPPPIMKFSKKNYIFWHSDSPFGRIL